MTKLELYRNIERLRKAVVPTFSPPYKSKILCTTVFGLNLDVLDLNTPKLRGMSHIPSRSVLIDGKRSEAEQNFHCMHEIMHHTFHKNRPTKSYSSYEETQADQDPFIEWQANEGAAQFLVPLQYFIPDYIRVSRELAHNVFSQMTVFEVLADKYFVSGKVISNRVDSLNYEIYQYLHGVSIASISLRSKKYLSQKGWNLRHEHTFCRKCLEPVYEDYLFCRTCGGIVNDGHPLHRLGMVNTGAGYMIHAGIELGEGGHMKECPKCKNEEFPEGSAYCMICGKPAINQCTYAIADNVPDEYNQCMHREPLPGNARYCPYCGSETIFLREGALQPWDATEGKGQFPSIDDDDGVPLPF